jgi:integration host factor beta subunit
MTKKELTEKLKERLKDHSRKDLEQTVNIIFEDMKRALKTGRRIEIRGFGNFTVKSRKSRMGRNPKTGLPVHIAERKEPFFRVGKELKELVNHSS